MTPSPNRETCLLQILDRLDGLPRDDLESLRLLLAAVLSPREMFQVDERIRGFVRDGARLGKVLAFSRSRPTNEPEIL